MYVEVVVVVVVVAKGAEKHLKDRKMPKDESRNINDKVLIERLKASSLPLLHSTNLRLFLSSLLLLLP